MSKSEMSRRNFFKGASVAAAGVAAAGVLASCSSEESSAKPSEGTAAVNGFETRLETDVLIVGGGQSGFVTGIRLLELGIENVTLIDKVSGEGDDFGGSSYRSGGSWLMPVDESDQAKADFVDAVWGYGEGHTDKSLIEVMADRSIATLNWMKDQGVEYTDPEVKFPKFPELIQSSTAVRVSIPLLKDNFVANGGDLRFSTKAISINLDGQGVCGMLVRDQEGYYNISAKKVILCTGGYAAGAQFLEDHVEDGDEIITRTPEGIVGDGIYMAQEVGGYTVQSAGIKSVYLIPMSPENLEAGRADSAAKWVCINQNGERYFDETKEHWRHGQVLLAQPDACCAYVTDSQVLESIQEKLDLFEKLNIETGKFDTLEEVADFIGCPADALTKTITEFNSHIVEDHTEGLAINKTADALPINTPPYYVLYPIKSACSLIYGGIKTNTDCQVLERDGSIIPNLYAAGELQGGFFYNGYFGGTQMSKAAIFGHVAAEHAANSL